MIGLAVIVASSTGFLLFAWWWSRGHSPMLRWQTAAALALLLVGMLLPADVIDSGKIWAAGLWRDFGSQGADLPAPAIAHVVLFALAAFLLTLLRRTERLLPMAVFLVMLAATTEVLQHFSPGRQPSWLDVGLNLAGAAAGQLLSLFGLYIWRWAGPGGALAPPGPGSPS